MVNNLIQIRYWFLRLLHGNHLLHDMGGGACGMIGFTEIGGGAVGTGIGSIGGGAPDAISSALRRALLARNSAISLS